MPELPEVETIRLGLEKYLVGHCILEVKVRLGKVIKEGNVKDVIGARVIKVRRFGKALSIDLSNGWSLLTHIKLTGQLIYQGSKVPSGIVPSEKFVPKNLPDKHTHIVFYLDSNAVLFYRDVRQFGWIRIVRTKAVEKLEFIEKLGPEPLDGLTLQKFKEIVSKSSTKIKALIMDQKKIGGVGNIYANEALFLARIHPGRPASSLSEDEQTKLYKAILKVLRQGLKLHGATEVNFVDVLGQPGKYQEQALVYGREGKPCLNKCGGLIKKIRIGGRGTYFCPNCQR